MFSVILIIHLPSYFYFMVHTHWTKMIRIQKPVNYSWKLFLCYKANVVPEQRNQNHSSVPIISLFTLFVALNPDFLINFYSSGYPYSCLNVSKFHTFWEKVELLKTSMPSRFSKLFRLKISLNFFISQVIHRWEFLEILDFIPWFYFCRFLNYFLWTIYNIHSIGIVLKMKSNTNVYQRMFLFYSLNTEKLRKLKLNSAWFRFRNLHLHINYFYHFQFLFIEYWRRLCISVARYF